MLAERCIDLLTAYVDGELSNRQRKQVLRLLQRSPEARTLLRKMQEDANQLRNLPRRRLGADFPQQVLQAIADRSLQPARQRQHTARRLNLATWFRMGVAAAVLIGVGVGSYFYFAEPEAKHVAKNKVNLPDAPEKKPDNATAKKEIKPPVDQPKPKDPPEILPHPMVELPEDKPRPSLENPYDETLITKQLPLFPLAKTGTFAEVEVNYPLILKLPALDQGKLRTYLQKDTGFRLELPCRDGVKAFDRLKTAFKANGLEVVVDRAAQARLKQPKLKTSMAVYFENVTPEELVKILQKLGNEDKQAEQKRRGDGVFDGLVVSQLTREDRKEFADLSGIDLKLLQPPANGNGPLGMDPRRPISEGTAEQVARALEGQGTTPRPGSGKAAKAPDRLALSLLYNNQVRARTISAEVKRFLDNRKPSRPGTLQVYLVLRSD